jgi:4-diphosphocytidyl-2-C-methyl-D-erythritol kinase
LRTVARAKVNLTLAIRGRRPDGYHELESLTAFTRFGDTLEFRAGQPFSLEVDGPFATAIAGGNLIERAAELYARHANMRMAGEALTTGGGVLPVAAGIFRLDKQIPVAAGLGGGSADAAAALRLLSGLTSDAALRTDINPPSPSSAPFALLPLARELGADVPVCLFSKPAIMTGIGEQMRFLTGFPALPILLVNPRLPLATADVFCELRANPLSAAADRPPPLIALNSIDDVVSYAAARSNDLEAPAKRLLPVIGDMLEALASCPGALLARLSGSGPTCFALFRREIELEAAALQLSEAHPEWWIKATTLG